MKSLNKIILTILILTSTSIYAEDYCYEELLLNGYEVLYDAGLDTTNNWWAITKPFSNKFRLHVNGNESKAYDYIGKPTFSPNSNKWATFVDEHGSKYILTNDTAIYIPAETFGSILFSGNSEVLLYSYFEGSNEIIIFGDRRIEVMNHTGEIFLNYEGTKFAFIGRRGSYKVLNINGTETTQYEEIIPLGFWHNGQFLYAAKNGYSWEIYKDNKSIADSYENIMEGKINIRGDVAAFLVGGTDKWSSGIMLSDNYYEPVVSREYETVGKLTLHPFLPMMAFVAKYNHKYLVVFNSTEYIGNENIIAPRFTWNGDELYFFSCSSLNCYININGKRTKLTYGANLSNYFVHAPNSDTYAFTNSSNLIMNFISRRYTHTGWMVDRTAPTRYNRFDDTYEALGVIRDKLYMLISTVPR